MGLEVLGTKRVKRAFSRQLAIEVEAPYRMMAGVFKYTPICMCHFEAYLSRQPTSIGAYLLGDFKGYLKMISITRSALGITEQLTRPKTEANLKLAAANQALGDVKVFLDLLTIPKTLNSLRFKYLKAECDYKHLYESFKKREISSTLLLEVATDTCSIVKSTISLAGKTVFKPLKLADRHGDLGDSVNELVEGWTYLSIVKNGMKIGYLGGTLLLGTKKTTRVSFSLFFATGSALQHILKLNDVPIHPGVSIAFAIAKCFFEIYKVYERTI